MIVYPAMRILAATMNGITTDYLDSTAAQGMKEGPTESLTVG